MKIMDLIRIAKITDPFNTARLKADKQLQNKAAGVTRHKAGLVTMEILTVIL